MNPEAIMMVLSNANPAREQEFNDWYSDIHVVEVVKDLDGFDMAQRWRLSADQVEDTAPYRYLAIYRIKPGKLEVARAAIEEQRVERAAALAAGREPRIKLDLTLFKGQHVVWFYESLTEVVSGS